ncbi:hypothetical protein DEO72_LG11g1182 [Vigna unguiculata]|uniref:Uncharacterized protein n=1 Tax=Vigna unguiculata TaxID=3917 RepID=A0A4D6NNF2_VIGUN|nr:hypothetical protein DEO72_LG11g1182 [Vigna unguiculata]
MGAYKHSNNFIVNLAQAKELSLRRQEALAQAKSSRSGEIEIKGIMKVREFSLKRGLLA